MKIACITVSRKESIFSKMWVAHHGAMFGHENLYLNIHGRDGLPQELPLGVNLIIHDRSEKADRNEKNKWGRITQSQLAARLLENGYDWVVRLDIDEFLVLDPSEERTLPEVIQSYGRRKVIHATGIDMIHRLGEEEELSPGEMVLSRHKHGVISRAYSKPCLVSQAPRWRSGCHRVAGTKNHVISPEVFLFHLALSDWGIFQKRVGETYGDAREAQKALLEKRETTLRDSAQIAPMDFGQAQTRAINEMAPQVEAFLNEDRTRFISDPTYSDGYYTVIPDRFADQIQFVDINRDT